MQFIFQGTHSFSISITQDDKYMRHFCQVCMTFHDMRLKWVNAVMGKLASGILNLCNYGINPGIGLFFQ